MRIHQIIFLALVAAALIAGCVKSPRRIIGGFAGGVLGVLIPFLGAQVYVWRGGDPTAAGALPFFCFLTLPLGIAIGVIVANRVARSA